MATGISGAAAGRIPRRDVILVGLALPALAVVGAAISVIGDRFGLLKLTWVLIALLGVLISARDLRLAVTVLVLGLAYPFRSTLAFGVEIHTTHLIVGLIVVQMLALAHQRRLKVPPGLLAPIGVMLLGGLIGAIAGPKPGDGLVALGAGLMLSAAAGLAAAIVILRGGVAQLPAAVAIGVTGTSLVAFAQIAGVTPEALAPMYENQRVNGLFYHPNILGGFLVTSVLLLVGVAAYAWRLFALAPLLFGVPIGIGTAAVAMTLSRGALVGLVAGILVVIGLLGLRRRVAPLLVALLAVVAVTAVAVPQVPDSQRAQFVERFQDLQRPGAENGRTLIYEQARRVISDHPVTGVGPFVFGRILRERATVGGVETVVHAHSIFFEGWLSLGLLGLGGLVWLLVGTCRRLLAITRLVPNSDPVAAGWAIGALAALASLLVQGVADFLFWQIELLIVFFVIVGTAYGLHERMVRGA